MTYQTLIERLFIWHPFRMLGVWQAEAEYAATIYSNDLIEMRCFLLLTVHQPTPSGFNFL